MTYREIKPSDRLKPYVKCFYIFQSDLKAGYEDIVVPAGQMEIIFNLGDGVWESLVDRVFQTTPQVKLWGQITQPLNIRSRGKHSMLGIRFHTHTPGYFLNEEAWEFNNQVSNLEDVLGASVRTLHSQLRDTQLLTRRIELIENFLMARIPRAVKKASKIELIDQVVKEMQWSGFSENIDSIASRHQVTSRFLQKLFVQYIGVAPKLFSKINRFQTSLRQIAKREESLTSIAYECGYFDQAHFIRDFKSFTGRTPSAYSMEISPVSSAMLAN